MIAHKVTEWLRTPNLFFTVVALILTVLTFSALGIMASWAVDTEPPLKKTNGKFVEWSKDDPDVVWINWSGRRDRACPGIITRWIENGWEHAPPTGWVHALPTISLPYPDGMPIGSFSTMMPLEIPHHLDGPMELRTRIDYSCNPLQRIVPFSVNLPDVFIPPRPPSQTQRPAVIPTPNE